MDRHTAETFNVRLNAAFDAITPADRPHYTPEQVRDLSGTSDGPFDADGILTEDWDDSDDQATAYCISVAFGASLPDNEVCPYDTLLDASAELITLASEFFGEQTLFVPTDWADEDRTIVTAGDVWHDEERMNDGIHPPYRAHIFECDPRDYADA